MNSKIFQVLILTIFLFNSSFSLTDYILGVGIVDSFSNGVTQMNVIVLDVTTGGIEPIGDPITVIDDVFCNNVYANYSGNVYLKVATSNSLITIDTYSGEVISNLSYSGNSIGNGFIIQNIALDQESNTIVAIFNYEDKFFMGSIDSDSGVISIWFPISGASGISSCISALDYNNEVFYGTVTMFDITAFGINDGGVISQYTFGDFEQVVSAMVVDDTDGSIYVLTNDEGSTSYLWTCDYNLDTSQLECDVLTQFDLSYLAEFPSNVYLDDGLLYVLLFNDVTNDFKMYVVESESGQIVFTSDVADFSDEFSGGIFSLNSGISSA